MYTFMCLNSVRKIPTEPTRYCLAKPEKHILQIFFWIPDTLKCSFIFFIFSALSAWYSSSHIYKGNTSDSVFQYKWWIMVSFTEDTLCGLDDQSCLFLACKLLHPGIWHLLYIYCLQNYITYQCSLRYFPLQLYLTNQR